jgi:hypothetical protein
MEYLVLQPFVTEGNKVVSRFVCARTGGTRYLGYRTPRVLHVRRTRIGYLV